MSIKYNVCFKCNKVFDMCVDENNRGIKPNINSVCKDCKTVLEQLNEKDLYKRIH